MARNEYGGVAQLARAYGSYPYGRWFKSTRRYHIRPVGQAVKTPPFHGDNGGSIPPRVTKKQKYTKLYFCFFIDLRGIEPGEGMSRVEND